MLRGGVLRFRAENLVLYDVSARQHDDASAAPWVVLTSKTPAPASRPISSPASGKPSSLPKMPAKAPASTSPASCGIVQTNRGFFSVQSTAGAGTTFRVFLPSALALPSGNGELILVVDDESAIRDVTTTTTLSRHGYRVIAAQDSSDGLALFAPCSREISVLITDRNMPRLDGAAIAGVVRRLNPAAKILAASGLGSRGKPGSPTPPFANAFLAKPFSIETLCVTLHQLLHPAPPF